MNKDKLIEIRDNLIKKTWEEKKNDWTMEDLSVIFNLSLVHLWRILKKLNGGK